MVQQQNMVLSFHTKNVNATSVSNHAGLFAAVGLFIGGPVVGFWFVFVPCATCWSYFLVIPHML